MFHVSDLTYFLKKHAEMGEKGRFYLNQSKT